MLCERYSVADLEKTEAINDLLDLYLPLLTEKQQAALKLVYQEDMSMQEAALLLGITKQTVHFNIQSALKHIKKLEDSLHLLEQNQKLADFISKYSQMPESDFNFAKLQADIAKLQVGN